ncbi:MAG: glycoside hydrolase family 3 protein [Lachnospiraceae bacterium]|nr:glycoside hydrolase family 3 protein [Lachnospiraceae bacterium]
MNKKSEKHKKIVRQRLLSAVITLLILGIISTGIYYGARVMLLKVNERREKENAAKAAAVSVEEKTKEPEETVPEEVEEDWYVSENEVSENSIDDNADTVSGPQVSAKEQAVIDFIEGMTLDQKICQLFIVKPEDLTGVDNVTAARDATREALEKFPVGGIIYFSENLVDPDQVKELLDNTNGYGQEVNSLPLFLCIDEENGSLSRFASNDKFDIPLFPSMWDMALSENAASAVYNAGFETGKYLKEFGFNVNLAPVSDVVTSSENSAIGTRSFGSVPEDTARLSWQYASGLDDSGVIPCFKHYPGLGETETDTHLGLASSRKTLKELKDSDLVPFENAVTSGAQMIMAGHISCPLVTGDDTPASLSDVMINQVLREDLGFEGIVITDSLQMNSVTDNYTCPDAVKLAVKAGADILLMPEDLEAAVNSLKDAVRNGEIPEERIDESLFRILRVKYSRLSTQ